MAFKIFGFEVKRSKETEEKESMRSVVQPPNDDGQLSWSNGVASAFYSSVLDIATTIKDENDLIQRYRDTASYFICDAAIEDIVSEAISSDSDEVVVKLNLDKTTLSESTKKKILECFEEVQDLMDFRERAQDIFKRWYIDGRLYYQINLYKDTTEGIADIRYVDPFKIRKIREIKETRAEAGVSYVDEIDEYFVYNPEGITESTSQGVRLTADSVAHINSGIIDTTSGIALGYLHHSIKPVNQLRMLEDSMVIYRMTRAVERRIFYVDVGTLPQMKADQYMNQIINKYRNKIVYDSQTGEIRDNRKHLSMQEDFFIPRREGNKATEVSSLPGGTMNNNIDDVEFFKKSLYQSLKVPISRLEPNTAFTLGKTNELTRDELKFAKFIDRLRNKFSELLYQILRVQLIAKKIISVDDWETIRKEIQVVFTSDNFFSEFKTNELRQQRLEMAQLVDPFVGKYYSKEYVMKEILKFTDEEEEEIKKQIDDEKESEEPAPEQGQFGSNPDGQNQTAPENLPFPQKTKDVNSSVDSDEKDEKKQDDDELSLDKILNGA